MADRWSAEQDEQMRVMISAKASERQIAEAVQRSKKAVSGRLLRLRRKGEITLFVRSRGGGGGWHPYSNAEDETIRALWPRMHIAQIAQQLQRTVFGVRKRGAKLGLFSCPRINTLKWSAEQDNTIWEMRSKGMLAREIAAAVGSTKGAVSGRLSRLRAIKAGVDTAELRRQKAQPFTTQEDDLVRQWAAKELTLAEIIQRIPHRSHNALYKRGRKLGVIQVVQIRVPRALKPVQQAKAKSKSKPAFGYKPKMEHMTKSELRDMLHQAVLNTGGRELVEEET